MSVKSVVSSEPLRLSDPSIRDTFRASKKSSCTQVLRTILFAPFTIAAVPFRCTRNLIQRAISPYVYHASSGSFKKKMEPERLEKSREGLRQLGGQTIAIRTVDGDWLEAMYFDIEKFKQAVVSAGGRFMINDNGKEVIRSYDPQLTQLLTKTLKLEGSYVSDPDLEDDLAFEVELASTSFSDRLIADRQVSVVTQGNASIFEMDRSSVASALLKGQSCLSFNIRGTGRSHGTPLEERTYRDIEAVHQFLLSQGYASDQMTVHGYCLGAGLAVDLASKEPVHLILDRPFAKIGDVIADLAIDHLDTALNRDGDSSIIRSRCGTVVAKVVSGVMNFFVISYDNHSKLSKVRGSICYIHSDKDEVIPEQSRAKMKKALESTQATIRTSDQFEHCTPWDSETHEVYEKHLRANKMMRRFPQTGLPPTIALGRLSIPWYRREGLRRDASIIAAGTLSGGGSGALGGTAVVAATKSYKYRQRIAH